MRPSIELLHEDGYDLQWGTNVVCPFLFTELLMPALIAGAKTSPDHHARVVTVSSVGAYMQTLDWDTFRDGPARRKLSTEDLYYQSKHVLFLSRLAVAETLMFVLALVGQRRGGATDREALRRQGHRLHLCQSRWVHRCLPVWSRG